jgi:cytochrome c oxidase assembly protein subunit 15
LENHNTHKGHLFRRLGIATIIAVYVLILVGGIVRSTGAGMGCPDWPRCFGAWIPPTNVSQLPADYQAIYAQKRADKNLKVAHYLDKLGFAEVAEKLRNDKSILEEAPFNAIKTWIEYVNRLVGVLIGLFIISTFLASFTYWKLDKTIVWLSLFSVILVIFQGWIGSVVVSTNLLPGIVSIHMILALLLVCVIIYTITRSYSQMIEKESLSNISLFNILLFLAIVLSLVQIILGIQVREEIDILTQQLGAEKRNLWIENLGNIFYIHRSFSWLVLGLNGWIAWILWKNLSKNSQILLWGKVLLAVFLIEIISGATMGYFDIPAFIQPVHLLLANLAIGVQFLIGMLMNKERFFSK